MDWLTANAGTVFFGLLLAVMVFFLLRSTVKSRKNGCSGCSGCSGCYGCRASSSMHGKGKER